MSVNTQDIVSVFNTFRVDMKLTDAFKIAAEIQYVFSPEMEKRYAEGVEQGKKANQYNIQDAYYDKGYAAGKADGERQAENSQAQYEMKRLKRIEAKMLEMAKGMAADVIKEHGRDHKIKCIKELRLLTDIGLKDAKDIIDAACKLWDENLAWELKKEMEEPKHVEK